MLACAPYWLPFLVRVRQAWSAHPPGTGLAARQAFLALQWLVPNAFAHRMRGLFDSWGNFGFLGAFIGVVALIGIIVAVVLSRGRRPLVWIAGPLFLALRVYGAPFTLWISKLPLLDRMVFELYFQSRVLYCLGIGGILGLSLLEEASGALRVAIVCAAGLLALAAILLAPRYTASANSALSPFWSQDVLLYAPAVVLAAVLAWASVSQRLRPPLRAWARALLFLCVTAELVAYREHLAVRGNPTAIPGYAAWLQQKQETEPPFRVFGLSLTMMPNFATAFGLEDVRLCDALVSRAYVAFEHRFLQKDLRWGWFLTAERAAGFNPESPILDWLNVRYLVGSLSSAGPPPTALEGELLAAHHAGWDHRAYEIDRRPLPLLFEYPNDEGSALIHVPADQPVLPFELAQDPDVWNDLADGATQTMAMHAKAGQRRAHL